MVLWISVFDQTDNKWLDKMWKINKTPKTSKNTMEVLWYFESFKISGFTVVMTEINEIF